MTKSPTGIVAPPSPENEITWRSGKAACAPIACAIAFAIAPCQNDPISQRLPFSVKLRPALTVGEASQTQPVIL